jgi:hypothetical protein
VAKIRVECDESPDAHTVFATLDLQDESGAWTPQAVVEEPDHRIPKPGGIETYYVTHPACVPGSWRATATATGSMIRRSFEYTTSRTATVTPEKCRR